MLKFLRKYQKSLLVVFASFLMIVFVAPQAITQYGRGLGKRTENYIGDRKVSLLDLQQAGREREAVAAFLGTFMGEQYARLITGEEDSLHWLMLTHAARQAGYVGEAGDGQAWVDELATRYASFMEMQAQQMGQADRLPDDPDEILAMARIELDGLRQRAAGNTRLSLEDFDMALAKARGVQRMIASYQQAPRISRPAAIAQAHHQLDDVDVDFVFIPGDRAFEGEITDQQLQEHFETFRNVEPSEGEYGIGYVRPARVKFEVITLDRDAIQQAIPITAREMVGEYQAHPERYVTEFDESLSEQELRDLRQAEYEKARQRLRAERAGELMEQAAAQVRRLVLPTLTAAEDGGYVIPEGAEYAGPSLDGLADDIRQFLATYYQRRYGADEGAFDPPLPEIKVFGATWRTLAELNQLPDLGQAQVAMGGNRAQRFGNFLLSARELNPEASNDSAPQVGVLAINNPIRNQLAGTLSFVRILDAREQSPAESLDEVQEQAESDLRSLLGFQQVRDRVSEFEAVAVSDGLEAVGELFNETPEDEVGPQPETEPRPPLRVQRGASLVAGRIQGRLGGAAQINEPEMVERLEQMAENIDPLVDISEIPVDQRTVAMALPKRLGVAVAQITGMLPLTVERFRTDDVQNQVGSAAVADINAFEAFSFESLVHRLDVTEADGSSPLEDDDEGSAG